MMQHLQYDVDVLIIGGGPVGLTLAVALQRLGVRFRIIDAKSGPEEHSKASNLWPRTQEVFAALGILDPLLRHSAPLHAIALHAFGASLGTVRMDNNRSPYPIPLFVGQNVIERELSQHLSDLGVEIERNTTALSLKTNDDSVSVDVDCDDQISTISARYVVGCDGPFGFTRKQVGLDFESEQLEGRILRQIDAKVRWSRPAQVGIASFFLGDNEYLGYLPLPDGYGRIFLVTPDADVPDRRPTIEEMEAGFRQVTGDAQAELSDAIWLTRGRLQHGIAPSFQRGRVLLAGDAGHMTIPVYGQGMNTGMQDAFNLAWKLRSALVKNVSGLLESYSEERHTVRAALNEEQGAILQRAAYPSGFQKLFMPLVGAAVLRLAAGRHLRDRSAQLKIAYPRSSLSHREGRHSGLGAGERAPDAIVVRGRDLATTTLFAEIYHGGWTLLCFEAQAEIEEAGVWAEIGEQLEEEFPDVRVLHLSAALPTGGATSHTIIDCERYAHKAYNVTSSPCCFLVRPDGYIGFSSHDAALDSLHAYCTRWLLTR